MSRHGTYAREEGQDRATSMATNDGNLSLAHIQTLCIDQGKDRMRIHTYAHTHTHIHIHTHCMYLLVGNKGAGASDIKGGDTKEATATTT